MLAEHGLENVLGHIQTVAEQTAGYYVMAPQAYAKLAEALKAALIRFRQDKRK